MEGAKNQGLQYRLTDSNPCEQPGTFKKSNARSFMNAAELVEKLGNLDKEIYRFSVEYLLGTT